MYKLHSKWANLEISRHDVNKKIRHKCIQRRYRHTVYGVTKRRACIMCVCVRRASCVRHAYVVCASCVCASCVMCACVVFREYHMSCMRVICALYVHVCVVRELCMRRVRLALCVYVRVFVVRASCVRGRMCIECVRACFVRVLYVYASCVCHRCQMFISIFNIKKH